MNQLVFILAFMWAAPTCAAQINVSGVVVEKGSNEPLTGASVILRNAEGKIKKYASSDANGKFSISTPDVKGYTIDVSMMSFAKQTVKLDSVQLPIYSINAHTITQPTISSLPSSRNGGSADANC